MVKVNPFLVRGQVIYFKLLVSAVDEDIDFPLFRIMSQTAVHDAAKTRDAGMEILQGKQIDTVR